MPIPPQKKPKPQKHKWYIKRPVSCLCCREAQCGYDLAIVRSRARSPSTRRSNKIPLFFVTEKGPINYGVNPYELCYTPRDGAIAFVFAAAANEAKWGAYPDKKKRSTRTRSEISGLQFTTGCGHIEAIDKIVSGKTGVDILNDTGGTPLKWASNDVRGPK